VQPRTALAFAAGFKIGKLGVSINEHLQTSDPDIYAVGDMTESEHLVTDRPTSGALADRRVDKGAWLQTMSGAGMLYGEATLARPFAKGLA
jgi:pyruvate/2-oxoglutarate dehydrogenase complex dihydrolipoamide dehydrogenase (E3) component